ncbi:hypothetical protein FQR65_LT03391 [Abscondita terminalis]|nr:hypothetical protein FQR65_LT03391 [Abscondita terminalis]
MKPLMLCPNKSSSQYAPYFWCRFSSDDPVAIQDTIHIMSTKITTRLPNWKVLLEMGDHLVKFLHLEIIIKEY